MPLSRSFKPAVLALALAGPILIGGCDRQSESPAQPGAQSAAKSANGAKDAPAKLDRTRQGSELPDFTLFDPAGNTLRLRDLKGQPILINLWATWCAPCVAELPTLNTLASRSGDRLRVVTVSQDSGAPDKVKAFLAQRGGDLPAWLDPQNDLSFHYATGTLPTTVLYDSQGREVWRYVGEQDWAGADAAKLLAEAK